MPSKHVQKSFDTISSYLCVLCVAGTIASSAHAQGSPASSAKSDVMCLDYAGRDVGYNSTYVTYLLARTAAESIYGNYRSEHRFALSAETAALDSQTQRFSADLEWMRADPTKTRATAAVAELIKQIGDLRSKALQPILAKLREFSENSGTDLNTNIASKLSTKLQEVINGYNVRSDALDTAVRDSAAAITFAEGAFKSAKACAALTRKNHTGATFDSLEAPEILQMRDSYWPMVTTLVGAIKDSRKDVVTVTEAVQTTIHSLGTDHKGLYTKVNLQIEAALKNVTKVSDYQKKLGDMQTELLKFENTVAQRNPTFYKLRHDPTQPTYATVAEEFSKLPKDFIAIRKELKKLLDRAKSSSQSPLPGGAPL